MARSREEIINDAKDWVSKNKASSFFPIKTLFVQSLEEFLDYEVDLTYWEVSDNQNGAYFWVPAKDEKSCIGRVDQFAYCWSVEIPNYIKSVSAKIVLDDECERDGLVLMRVITE